MHSHKRSPFHLKFATLVHIGMHGQYQMTTSKCNKDFAKGEKRQKIRHSILSVYLNLVHDSISLTQSDDEQNKDPLFPLYKPYDKYMVRSLGIQFQKQIQIKLERKAERETNKKKKRLVIRRQFIYLYFSISHYCVLLLFDQPTGFPSSLDVSFLLYIFHWH